jgi:hypothetical protein
MIKIVILAFDNHKRVSSAISRLYATTEIAEFEHSIAVVDPHYPLPFNNSALIKEICDATPNCTYLDLGGNFGQDGNMNLLARMMTFESHDTVIFYDTDIAIDKAGWIRDSKKLIEENISAYVTVGCFHNVGGNYFNVEKMQGPLQKIHDINVKELTWSGGWPIGIFAGHQLQGLNIKDGHSYYGASEYTFMQTWLARGLKGHMLVDYVDVRNFDGIDPLYPAWKADVIAKKTHPDFKDWLIERNLL